MGAASEPSFETDEDDIAMEKNAGLIMGTNNSSIVSKRSVERLYLPEPHFYRYFVRKPQRRSPTINRGYWLRMRAIDWVVRQFLERQSDQKKVIINLGCGYDPIPFQWMTQEPDLCKGVKFIDIDYDELMVSKRGIVLNTPKMKDLLKINEEPTSSGVLINSEEYVALGCDLRNLKKLGKLVKSVVDIENCIVLCIAEVSITYMATEDADALIAWSSTISPDVTFCLLEQMSPDRPDNPFTATMLKHFAKLGTPLRSVLKYPGNHTQTMRFQDAGYITVEAQSLWELWADTRFLSPSQRMALDQVEPFDEWEEFALFASHYGLIVAQTGPEPLIHEQPRSRRDSTATISSDITTRTVSPYRAETQWFAYKYSALPDREGRTHHGSAFSLPEQDAIAIYGGVGSAGRLSTTAVYTSSDSIPVRPIVPPKDIGARCAHTITTLGNGQNILIGGRASPSAPLKDCWLQTGSKWERIDDLPEPRYRHRAVAVQLPDDQWGVVVFGGKTSACTVAVDHIMWDPKNGWQRLRSLLQDPMPRFGASFIKLGFNHGLLFGGMRQDGVICQGLWRWRLIIRDNAVVGIRFKTSTALDMSVGMHPWIARMGASYSVIRNELLLIGGVGKLGCIQKDYEILSILGSFSAFSEFEKEMELRVSCVAPRMAPDVPRPFLIGHCSHRTTTETTLIVGGGATCFSFGAYWNPGVWLMHDREAGTSSHWSLVKPLTAPPPPRKYLPNGPQLGSYLELPPRPVEYTSIETEKDFTKLVENSVPKILINLDIGRCSDLWTPTYLLSRATPGRMVTVHSAPSRIMNFQRKDFTYTTLPFHNFLKILISSPLAHMYLRSISSASPTTLPANLTTDWPEIAHEFKIPSQLSFLESNLHSSPIRISGNINMWLHYDVMANVLFQIHGAKKLILFPPSDLKYLSFPPGSTTSTLDIFEAATTPGEEDTIKSIPSTHPVVAILKPGDALFIPPLWAHTGTPLSQTSSLAKSSSSTSIRTSTQNPKAQTKSNPQDHNHIQPQSQATKPDLPPPSPRDINIAVNLFFRSLPTTRYAAGRDVYGNRDLAAYEDGRRDLERILRRFGGESSTISNGTTGAGVDMQMSPEAKIPRDVVKAYLYRLVDEMREKADAL